MRTMRTALQIAANNPALSTRTQLLMTSKVHIVTGGFIYNNFKLVNEP